MNERLNIIGHILIDMLAVYGLLILCMKYFPKLLPFKVDLDMVAVVVLMIYVIKVIFTKKITIKDKSE